MSPASKTEEGPAGSCRGATLVEVLVALSVLMMALGIVGRTVFQVVSMERSWRDDVGATRALRHAESWFTRDAFNAEATDLVDGGPPVSSVTLTWQDGAGAPRSAVYTLTGGQLLRQSSGDTTVLASQVVSAGFTLSGRSLSLDVEVQAEQGTTETSSLFMYLRRLP